MSRQETTIERIEIMRRPDGWLLTVKRGDGAVDSYHPTDASLLAELRWKLERAHA